MSYHPRIESKVLASFLTTRARNSELWFINNKPLEEAVLGYAAKFADRYGVKLYALAIEGNHIQAPALFPNAHRADFMRDFNSCVARSVKRLTPEYTGGIFWGRRYSGEFLPEANDIEEYFFYTVLQPVQDGLVEHISEYPFYNCFKDAVNGIKREYKVIHWAEYNARKRYNSRISIKDYEETVFLEYSRLPGYENLTQLEYAKIMYEKLENRRLKIVKERKALGLGFLGRARLLKIIRGSIPKNSKKSTRYSYRPRILSISQEAREYYKNWYFSLYEKYKVASTQYRAGNLSVQFPEGTYRPFVPVSVN